MQYSKPIIVASLHLGAPLLGGLAAHLWEPHPFVAMWIGASAILMAVGTLMRDLYLDEVAECLSPTHTWHGSTVIEPPKPLPAFDPPSRIRIKPLGERLIESVAPSDGDPENTWPEVG